MDNERPPWRRFEPVLLWMLIAQIATNIPTLSKVRMRAELLILRAAVLASVLVVVYAIGLVSGNGLHLHGSLGHEHDGSRAHSHSWTAHVHESTIASYRCADDAGISREESNHDHRVPLIHIIAVPASPSPVEQIVASDNPSSFDLTAAFGSPFPVPSPWVYPREASPPFNDWPQSPNSGRSPPIS